MLSEISNEADIFNKTVPASRTHDSTFIMEAVCQDWNINFVLMQNCGEETFVAHLAGLNIYFIRKYSVYVSLLWKFHNSFLTPSKTNYNWSGG